MEDLVKVCTGDFREGKGILQCAEVLFSGKSLEKFLVGRIFELNDSFWVECMSCFHVVLVHADHSAGVSRLILVNFNLPK